MGWIEMSPKGNIATALTTLANAITSVKTSIDSNTTAINSQQKIKSIQCGVVTTSKSSITVNIASVDTTKCKVIVNDLIKDMYATYPRSYLEGSYGLLSSSTQLTIYSHLYRYYSSGWSEERWSCPTQWMVIEYT